MRLRLMGMKGKMEYQPLSEERAAELGSEILGEAFLYTVAASYIVYEYWNSRRKEQQKTEVQDSCIAQLQAQTQKLESEMARLRQILEHNNTTSCTSQSKAN